MNKAAIGLIIGVLVAAPAQNAYSESRPIALPNDSRLIEFVYRPNEMYTVLTRPESITNIQLGDDEELVTLAMGDTAQWVVTNAERHIFIKPVFPDLVTSATLVTTKRTYQLTLRSSPVDGKFYQQVTWHNPQLVAYRNELAATRIKNAELENKFNQARIASTIVTPNVELENLNFDYSIDGDADFAPTTVFDDGKFTWIRLKDTQEMPAVFMKDGRNVELLNFTLRDNFIVIHRIVPGVLLKLGNKEVVISKAKKGWFSGWGSAASSHENHLYMGGN